MKQWWHALYDENLAYMLLESEDSSEAKATIRFLCEVLGLQRGSTVFDQCCGTGRLALLLAKDHLVLGVDVIPQYIDMATNKLKLASLDAELYCDDALTFVSPQKADFVVNWWTSFGYSLDDCENRKMIHRAYESLRSGGSYVLDFMNVPGIYRNFQRDVMLKKQTPNGHLTLIRRSEIDFEREVLLKDWHYFIGGGQEIHHKSTVKLYTPAKLMEFFSDAGFASIQIYGDLDGQALSLDSPRCIVVGKKI